MIRAMKSASNEEKEHVSITVRIPEHIPKRIDASLDQEGVLVSRSHWIIKALVEELRLTEAGGGSNGTQ